MAAPLVPFCDDPASLVRCHCPDGFVIVGVRWDLPLAATAQNLATKYGMSGYTLVPSERAFATRVSDEIIRQLRCDPSVRSLQQYSLPDPSGEVMCHCGH
jgi:hypothetical protein